MYVWNWFLEICIIALFAIIFVGPQKLPELMRQTGKLFIYLRRLSNEAKYTLNEAIEETETNIYKDYNSSAQRKNQHIYNEKEPQASEDYAIARTKDAH